MLTTLVIQPKKKRNQGNPEISGQKSYFALIDSRSSGLLRPEAERIFQAQISLKTACMAKPRPKGGSAAQTF